MAGSAFPFSAAPRSTPSKGGGGHGVSGFLGHLSSDVRDAVVGLPSGLINMAEHPVGSVENMAKATWHDWSPLVHGNLKQFGNQLYDHPLAPLLDVATVFSGGAALAGKSAALLSKAGVDNGLVNALKEGSRAITLHDPLPPDANGAVRESQILHTSANPLNRAIHSKYYQVTGQLAQHHLPKWFTPAGKFERMTLVKNADNVAGKIRTNEAAAALHSDLMAANNAQLAGISHAGKLLSTDPTLATPLVLNHVYDSAMTHGLHYDDLMRHGNGKIINEPGGMKPVYKTLPKGRTYLRMKDQSLMDSMKHNTDVPFEQRLVNYGHVITTTDPLKAARDSSGKAILVHNGSLEATLRDGAKSSRFLKAWYKYPTNVWKMALVGLSPKMVVDNAVGNWTMYAMKQGGHHAIRGIMDAMHQTHGLKVASKTLKGATDQVLNPHWMDKHFKNEIGNQSFMGATLKDTLTPDPEKLANAGGVLKHPNKFLGGGLYPLVHKIADQPVRRAALNAYMRGAPEVKAAMDRGMSFDQATGHVLKNDKSGKVFQQATNHVRAVAGDYHTLSNAERTVKDLVPFYLWDKHIVRHFSNVLANNPGRVAMLQQLSHQGVLHNAAGLGAVPQFMLGDIPMGTSSNGRKTALSTQGLNPYSTIADLTDAFTAATTGGQKASAGEAIGGQGNPVLTSLIESITGHNIGTDAAVKKHGGVGTTALINMAESLPQVKILQALANPGGNSNEPGQTASGAKKLPKLYQNSLADLLSNTAGFPIKHINSDNAASLSNKENNIKKGKKTSAFPFGG